MERAALRHPRVVVALALLQVLVIVPGLCRLELEMDGRALASRSSPTLAEDTVVRERFDLGERVAVVVESRRPEGIYDAEILQRIRELTRAIEDLEFGPTEVESLATERSDRVRTGSLELIPWLDLHPPTPQGLARLRADLEDAGIYSGTLIAKDHPASAAAVLVELPPGIERATFATAVRSAVYATLRPGDEDRLAMHVVGPPLAESELGLHVLADLRTLVPIAMLAMAALFYLAFGSLVAALIPLLELGAVLPSVFALMGWLGTPVYLTSAVLPVVLTAAGVADDLHLLTAFLQERARSGGAGRGRWVEAALGRVSRPMVITSVTTALGFLAFAVSPLPPVRAFGLYAAVGVLHCLTWSLLVTPALLVWFPSRRWGTAGQGGGRWSHACGARLLDLERWVHGHPGRVLGGCAALGAACLFGLARVKVRDSWLAGFSPSSELRRATERADALFAGTHLLQIAVRPREIRAEGRLARQAFGEREVLIPARLASDPAALRGHRLHVQGLDERAAQPFSTLELTARILAAEETAEGTLLVYRQEGAYAGTGPLARWLPPAVAECAWRIDAQGYLADRAVLERIGDFERFLGALSGSRVERALGPWEHLTTMRYLAHGRRPELRSIPDEPHEIEALLTRYALARGEGRLRRLVDPERTSALVTVFLNRADSESAQRALRAARSYAREHLEPEQLTIEVGGDAAVSAGLVDEIVRTQVRSFLLALPAVALVVALAFGSLRAGLACLVPPLFALLVDYGVLGLAGLPLGVATSMFAAMTIAIGVDYAIHLGFRRDRALAAGESPRSAVQRALFEAGPAVTLDALALAAAFGLFSFSRVPINARLGTLMALSLLTCLVVSVVGPCLLAARQNHLTRGAAPARSNPIGRL